MSGRNGESTAIFVGLHSIYKLMVSQYFTKYTLTYIGVVIVVGAFKLDRLAIVSLL